MYLLNMNIPLLHHNCEMVFQLFLNKKIIYICVIKNIVIFGGGRKTSWIRLNTVIARDATIF